jgi:hypothetical protein
MPPKKGSGSKTPKKIRVGNKRYLTRKKAAGEKLYFGIKQVPKGRKRATAGTALRHHQVRFYGEHAVPKPIMTVYLHGGSKTAKKTTKKKSAKRTTKKK